MAKIYPITTGMFTPDQASVFLTAAAAGTALLDGPVAGGDYQAGFVGIFLTDMLANLQMLNATGMTYDKSNHDWPMFVVIAVNALEIPIPIDGQTIWSGTQIGQASGTYINPLKNYAVDTQTDTVPAAEEGNPGFAAWMVCNSQGAYGTNFGLGFSGAPFSIGCMGNYADSGSNQISLIAGSDATTAQNNAYSNTNSFQAMYVATTATIGGASVAIDVRARMQQPDATRVYIVVISVVRS